MGLFQPNYNKPGKGVDENAPEKRSFFRFWELFGRKFGKLVKLGLIYFLALIPTFLIFLFLTGMITSPILSDGFLRESIREVANQMAATMQTTPAELEIKICVTLDGVCRVILSFLIATLWGMGPATAGATYIWRNFSREEHAWLWSDFKDSVKNNAKQALAVFLIDVAVFVLLCSAIRVYASMGGFFSILQYFVWIVALIYTMMHFYLYPMMVTFELSLRDLYKNALIFAVGKLPSNLFIFGVLAVIQLVPAYFVASLFGEYFVYFALIIAVLEAVVLLGFSGFLVNFNAFYKMRKYMMPNAEDKEDEIEAK